MTSSMVKEVCLVLGTGGRGGGEGEGGVLECVVYCVPDAWHCTNNNMLWRLKANSLRRFPGVRRMQRELNN